MASLRDASGISVLGSRPFATLTDDFDRVADRSRALSTSMTTLAGSLDQDTADFATVAADAAVLRVQIAGLRDGEAADDGPQVPGEHPADVYLHPVLLGQEPADEGCRIRVRTPEQPQEILAAAFAIARELERRDEQRHQDAFARERRRRRLRLQPRQQFQARLVHRVQPSGQDRLEQLFLRAEVIVDGRDVRTRGATDLADRDVLEAGGRERARTGEQPAYSDPRRTLKIECPS